MSVILNATSLTGALGAGSLVLGDYRLEISAISDGYRLTVTRGSEVQTMEVRDGASAYRYAVGAGYAGTEAEFQALMGQVSSAVSGEAERVEAERVEAEAARMAAETERTSAEETRESAESGRASAESERAGAEANRVAAEANRQQAEIERTESFSNIRVAVEPTDDGAILTATGPDGSTTQTKITVPDAVRFGVSGVGGANPALTRLWDSVDMGTPTPGTDTVPGSSAFDNYAPFNRRKCVGSWSLVNGRATFTINAYYGDPDYTEDGTNGNYVAVEVDPFYYFEGGGILGVSTHQYPGWRIHPVCLDYDGNVREHTYLPCYQVSLKNGTPVSLPGYYPENGSYSQLMTKLRGYSAALANHVMLEPSAVNHYEWLLYTIEFATQNCQSIMSGASTMQHGEDMITAVPAPNKIVMAKSIAQNYVLGQTVEFTTSIWNSTVSSTAFCQIMALELCDENGTPSASGNYYLVTYSGDDRSSAITIGSHRCVSRAWICGATQGYAPGVPPVLGHTGSPVSNTSGKYPCVYRYRENPFGNQSMTSMDLFDVRVDEGNEVYHLEWYLLKDPRKWMPYATKNPDLADLQNPDRGFRKLTVITPSSSYIDGYISAEDADPNFPHIHVPVKAAGGSASTFTCDIAYFVHGYVVRLVRRGGVPHGGVTAGFRCVLANFAPQYGGWHFGGGLYFIQ